MTKGFEGSLKPAEIVEYSPVRRVAHPDMLLKELRLPPF